MPTSKAAPNVTALNAVTALSNTADPLNPSVPNGIITACNVTCGPSSPLILNTTILFHVLQWNAPLQPDYVITGLTLHHRVPSLKSQSEMPQSQFHAYNSSGILFYQINSLSLDPTVPEPSLMVSGTLGNVVLFEQASNTFYVTVDTVHAAAITDVIVPLLTMKSTLRDFPAHEQIWHCNPLQHVSYPLLNAPDGFDAVSVQNVGSTYIIVSWDLPTHSNGILINFSLYCNGALAGVLPLTVISYNTTGLLPFTFYMYITLSAGQVLQSRPQALHSSWKHGLGVISAAASLPRHKRFHTLFDLLKYGLMSKYNVMCSSLDPMEELTATPPYPS
eukprot:Em0009g865a